MRKILFFLMVCQSINVLAQLREDFHDGVFEGENRAIAWSGDVSEFQVNAALELQLNSSKTGNNSTAQLRTPNFRLQHTTWLFNVKMTVNPTSGNYVKVFLTSDEADFLSPLNGFYVRVGHTKDNLSLIRSVKGSTDEFLIEGREKRLDKSTFTVTVKVVFDDDGQFQLYSRLSDETDFSLEGSCVVSNENLPAAQWFGWVCTFSGTNNKKYYFDNIVVKDSDEDDPEPPALENLPEAADLIINEILYDPPAGGEEYVELYNRSDRTIDLRYLSITTRKSSDGSLNKAYPLSIPEFLLPTHEYVFVTKNRAGVCSYFQCREESFCAEPENMAALANAGGCIVIFNNQTDEIIDQVNYLPSFHSIASKDQKGVSLERISFDAPSDEANNWTSATSASGGGTPGYANSQLTGVNTTDFSKNNVYIEYPNTLSLSYLIHYTLDRPAFNCRILVFDSLGRKADTIAENDIVGSAGTIEWKTVNRLNAGLYIIYMEVFSQDGRVQTFKVPAVVR